ncbi:sulfatase, partial [Romboutsia ilealis]|nr:sulfatase [Romboutsia ilealis]
VDKNIGKLISHLKEKEVYEDTIIIYFGDNGTADGCVMDENGRLLEGYNAGMRGKKGMAYEGAHRNACFITTPGNLLGVPREVHGITAQMDILPTLAEICGL